MKISELKNTPWVMHKDPMCITEGIQYAVDDKNGKPITFLLDEPTAKAIAALPETLKRLERLEEKCRLPKGKVKCNSCHQVVDEGYCSYANCRIPNDQK